MAMRFGICEAVPVPPIVTFLQVLCYTHDCGEECPIFPRYRLYAALFLIAGYPAHSACRDCAQPGFGGPGENRFTAFDPICRGEFCREPGFPQVFVNTSNLTL